MDGAYEQLIASQELEALTEVPLLLDEEQQESLVKELKHHLTDFRSSVSGLHKELPKWHRLYDARRPPVKKYPWPGASNYSVPLIMSTVDSLHARVVKAVFEVDPLWVAKAYTAGSHDIAKKAEWYLDTWADAMGLAQVLDMVAFNMLVEGVGILKLDWVKETRRVPVAPTAEMGTNTSQEVVEYEGPRGYSVPLADFVMIPADAPTLDDAVYVGHRVYLTEQTLRQRQASGLYSNVDALLERGPGGSIKQTNSSKEFGNVHGITVDTSLVQPTKFVSKEYPETNQYELFELYGPYVFDEEVGPEPALFTLSEEHSILLRIEPYPYQYGRAPYVDFNIYKRPNFFWGRSVPDMLESAQSELEALHNMRGDSLSMQIAPPILQRQGGVWDPTKHPFRPGQVIPVSDNSELFQLGLRDIPSSVFSHERDIMDFSERITGMSDVFMGRVGSPYQTATATTAARSEGLVRLDVSITRFQESMKRVAWILWWMLFQFRPMVDTFHVDELDADYTITKAEMAPGTNGLMPFEFLPQGTQSDASKEARRQQLIFLLNTMYPALQQNYPDGIQALLGEMLDAFDVKNKSEILGPPWQQIQQMLQQALQQGIQMGAQQAQQGVTNVQG